MTTRTYEAPPQEHIARTYAQKREERSTTKTYAQKREERSEVKPFPEAELAPKPLVAFDPLASAGSLLTW